MANEVKNLTTNRNTPTEEESPVITEGQILKNTKKSRLTFKQAIKYSKKIIQFGKPFHKYLYLALISIFIQTFFELLVPIYLGRAIDCIVGAGSVDFHSMGINLIYVSASILINVLFTWLGNLFTNIYCFKSSEYMRQLIFQKFISIIIYD